MVRSGIAHDMKNIKNIAHDDESLSKPLLHTHKHLGHLADAFIQSDLQIAHLLKETTIYRCGT